MTASILIVDDEPGMRDMLRWELDSQGHHITAAADGSQALDRIRSGDFDLVLSDIRMPGVDGLEVLRTTKALCPDTEVVVITGNAELGDAIACVRAGAFDFVQKPFEIPELLATVERALERRRLRTALGLFETSRAVLSSRDPKRLPELIVGLTMKVMGADDVSLMLPDADGRLYIACSHGLPEEIAAEVRLDVGERVAGHIAKTREPALLGDRADRDPRFDGTSSSTRVRSSIVYPLVAGDRLVGVLNINRMSESRPFRNADLERAGVLASQILLALENAALFKQMLTSERLASMGQLAASVAHEINDPLTHLFGMHAVLCQDAEALGALVDGLASGADLRAARLAWREAGGVARFKAFFNDVASLGESAARIKDIVQDVRSLACVERGAPMIVDVNQAIRSAVRVVGRELKLHALVTTQLGRGVDVLAHAGRLSQVFINLLMNAGQALAEQRRPDGRVDIRSEQRGDRVIVEVRDNGPGIRAEHVSRIFETFFTTKASSMGTGLGLSISRELIRQYGGDVEVESTYMKGAMFRVTLPTAVVALGAASEE